MRDTDQFARLLHIEAPWRVSLVDVDEPGLQVVIQVRLDEDVRVRCPQCDRECPRYDSRRRRWRHLDTMEFQTVVEADVPRVNCSEHGVLQVPVPWAEGSSRYTIA